MTSKTTFQLDSDLNTCTLNRTVKVNSSGFCLSLDRIYFIQGQALERADNRYNLGIQVDTENNAYIIHAKCSIMEVKLASILIEDITEFINTQIEFETIHMIEKFLTSTFKTEAFIIHNDGAYDACLVYAYDMPFSDLAFLASALESKAPHLTGKMTVLTNTDGLTIEYRMTFNNFLECDKVLADTWTSILADNATLNRLITSIIRFNLD